MARGGSALSCVAAALVAASLAMPRAGVGASSTAAADELLRIVRPSARDFVEIVRGGEAATELLVALRDGFAVPSDGYLVLRGFFASDDAPTIMCPHSVAAVDDCERGASGRQLTGMLRLTLFGVELGPQDVCVEVYDWDSVLLAETCQTLVGSERFPGLYDSLLYYEDRPDDFLDPDALHLLWSRIGAVQGGQEPFSLLFVGPRAGSMLLSAYFLQDGGGPRGEANTTASSALRACVGGAEHGAVYQVSQDGSEEVLATASKGVHLDAVWSQHGGGASTLRAVDIDASGAMPGQVVSDLSHTLETAEPVVIFSLPSEQNRTTLEGAVVALAAAGYHTFLVGMERLIMLSGNMWHHVYAAPLPHRAGDPAGALVYVGIKARSRLYLPLLAVYNASGMVVGCAPYRMSSFHTPDGYWADDCPPNFNVYRSSRLKHFEVALRERGGARQVRGSLICSPLCRDSASFCTREHWGALLPRAPSCSPVLLSPPEFSPGAPGRRRMRGCPANLTPFMPKPRESQPPANLNR